MTLTRICSLMASVLFVSACSAEATDLDGPEVVNAEKSIPGLAWNDILALQDPTLVAAGTLAAIQQEASSLGHRVVPIKLDLAHYWCLRNATRNDWNASVDVGVLNWAAFNQTQKCRRELKKAQDNGWATGGCDYYNPCKVKTPASGSEEERVGARSMFQLPRLVASTQLSSLARSPVALVQLVWGAYPDILGKIPPETSSESGTDSGDVTKCRHGAHLAKAALGFRSTDADPVRVPGRTISFERILEINNECGILPELRTAEALVNSGLRL